ncbi:Paf1-domain-containing protein [Cutaneotrichosporon oleaginosum]|uniref:Paf1-domain-containing protein n=1 Tax=Cutaneotrichosporon oleaginosum TaxID=879819 RepID=A0A0J0XWR4_9TREE|nr:Paf1-domain-containing protein [Cutaneotrichosporon oleaginosum]KLT45488.1 Paf1-domain-containing protein [Cutaneotrichosporon oleaginosum]TXT14556.1 hypothetical protein COLE_00749 [Cutaneotrichosporon oleaginosum]
MSKKPSKLDLLVRVRFENPLPDPPFPPKLLKVKTDISRLGDPAYLDQLAGSAPAPMLLDAEMGMPIDLNTFDGVWDGNDASLNPALENVKLEPADAALLAPLRILAKPNGAPAPSAIKPEVSWMRNSSYIQRRETTRRRAAAEAVQEEEVDASEAAQIVAIEKSFEDLRNQQVSEIRHPHPKRKHLRVVESYDVLPDEDTWSSSYILLKFPERPSAATALNPSAKASRGRLDRALLRPVVEEDQASIDFFLPKEDDLSRLSSLEEHPIDSETAAEAVNMSAEGNDDKIDELFPNVTYERIRTYEVVSQMVPDREFLLTISEEAVAKEDEEEDMFGEEEPKRKKRKGAYYKPISMRSQLRKTVQKVRSDTPWDKVRFGFREPAATEIEEREKMARSVSDSAWVEDQTDEGHDTFAATLEEADADIN